MIGLHVEMDNGSDADAPGEDLYPEPEDLACHALGRLVGAGVLPDLVQVMPSPT